MPAEVTDRWWAAGHNSMAIGTILIEPSDYSRGAAGPRLLEETKPESTQGGTSIETVSRPPPEHSTCCLEGSGDSHGRTPPAVCFSARSQKYSSGETLASVHVQRRQEDEDNSSC